MTSRKLQSTHPSNSIGSSGRRTFESQQLLPALHEQMGQVLKGEKLMYAHKLKNSAGVIWGLVQTVRDDLKPLVADEPFASHPTWALFQRRAHEITNSQARFSSAYNEIRKSYEPHREHPLSEAELSRQFRILVHEVAFTAGQAPKVASLLRDNSTVILANPALAPLHGKAAEWAYYATHFIGPVADRILPSLRRFRDFCNAPANNYRIEFKPAELRLLAIQAVEETNLISNFNNKVAVRTEGLLSQTPAGPATLVNADPMLIDLIVSDLLSNAIRYAARVQNSVVQVSLRTEANQAVLNFTDNGPGVAPDLEPRLFGYGQSSTGGGLGLHYGREAARAMGGDLKMVSARQPTVFELSLPLLG